MMTENNEAGACCEQARLQIKKQLTHQFSGINPPAVKSGLSLAEKRIAAREFVDAAGTISKALPQLDPQIKPAAMRGLFAHWRACLKLSVPTELARF